MSRVNRKALLMFIPFVTVWAAASSGAIQSHSRGVELDVPVAFKPTHVPLGTKDHYSHPIPGCLAAWWLKRNNYCPLRAE